VVFTAANRMSTPKGRSVWSRTRRISARSSAGEACAAAITPSPPAADTAAARPERATKAIPAWQIGYRIPRRSQSGVCKAERVAMAISRDESCHAAGEASTDLDARGDSG
jgi:hypothetical protein